MKQNLLIHHSLETFLESSDLLCTLSLELKLDPESYEFLTIPKSNRFGFAPITKLDCVNHVELNLVYCKSASDLFQRLSSLII
jgi:hypothetical protein